MKRVFIVVGSECTQHPYSFTLLKSPVGRKEAGSLDSHEWQALRDIKQVGSWEVGIPQKLIQKKAISLISSLPHSIRNFISFDSGYPLIALSEGEQKRRKRVKKEKKKKSEGKEVKTKTALAALAGKGMCCWHCRSHRLSIRALLLAWMKDGRQYSAQRNFHHQDLQHKQRRKKTKGSDEKESIGNEFLGNALFRE